jgi:hypothetical protein
MIAKGTEHILDSNFSRINKGNSENPLFILYVVVVILILPQAKSPSSLPADEADGLEKWAF